MKALNWKKIAYAAGLILGGLALGWVLFGGSGGPDSPSAEHADQGQPTIWTCSMHPQIRRNEPGLCPICAMELIPLDNTQTEGAEGKLEMTESAVALANIQTTRVVKASAIKEIQLNGKVESDERNVAQITSRFGGRIDRLFVNFTGQEVRKGEKLATIYSPALIAAQQELFEAVKLKSSSPSFYEAVKRKLRLWNITEAQIQEIEKSGKTLSEFEIVSPMSGTVLKRNVGRGDYVDEGSSLFEIANYSTVWVQFQAYESDLPWIKKGSSIAFSIQSVPGRTFKGRVAFIDPTVDPMTRVAYVRTELSNPGQILKPGMFARGTLTASLGGAAGLVVPKSAVLWTGARSVVYVKDETASTPVFEYREVVLGPDAGNVYMIREGLQEGELVVSNGTFTVDAAAQLQGKTSMMSAATGKPVTGHEQHGGLPGLEPDRQGSSSKAPHDLPGKFAASLSGVYDGYLKVKDALVKTDANGAKGAAKGLLAKLGGIEAAALPAESKSHWNALQKDMESAAGAISKASEVEKQRGAFSKLSGAVYAALKGFGHADETLYYQHCPMAFDNKGAYWLSAQEQIANPYFGSKMMKCGSTKETISK